MIGKNGLGECRLRPCPVDQVYLVDQCVALGSEGICNAEGERVLYDLSGEGVCESDDFHQDSCRAKEGDKCVLKVKLVVTLTF